MPPASVVVTGFRKSYADNYQLPGGNTFSGSARLVRARGQFDVSASYKFNDNLKFAVDAFNLTDSYYEEYEGSLAKLRRASYDGRTVQATLQYWREPAPPDAADVR